jgi:hypothetical protein
MRLLIKITKEVLYKAADCGINKKKMSTTKHCIIAEAVRPIFPIVEVSYSRGIIGIPNKKDDTPILAVYTTKGTVYIVLPKKAGQIMQDFDNIQSEFEYARSQAPNGYSPFVTLAEQAIAKRRNLPEDSFVINVPSELITLIGISEVHKILKNCNSLASIKNEKRKKHLSETNDHHV